MYLLDTSIILELLLDQEKASEAEDFLRATPPDELHLSEFSLYSLGVILLRSRRSELFLKALNDLLVNGGVQLVRLAPSDMPSLVQATQRFGLDFDDAYQYSVAKKYGLTLISFDAHFDRTDRGRKTPAQLMPAQTDSAETPSEQDNEDA